MTPPFDAILVPGGGLLKDGSLPPWVTPRFDRALHHALTNTAAILALSAATTHKPLPIDPAGRPVYESTQAARYLLAKGFPATRILTETASWDTIGNAWFARAIHTDPAGFRNLLIINSAFHMPRTEAIFRWVFALPPVSGDPYRLTFETVPDAGLSPEALRGRTAKEQAGLRNVLAVSTKIRTLAALHHWLFTEHDAYAAGREPAQPSDPAALRSY